MTIEMIENNINTGLARMGREERFDRILEVKTEMGGLLVRAATDKKGFMPEFPDIVILYDGPDELYVAYRTEKDENMVFKIAENELEVAYSY